MATVIVTGASSGIGKAISERLLTLGYQVIGISRTVETSQFEHPHFKALQCDLSNSSDILLRCADLQKDISISMLINAAGYGIFEPHEELAPKEIETLIAVNLQAPILLSNLFLRSIKQHEGMIINITSIEALRSSKFSALYSATKAGLRAFGNALFEEVRKSGVNVLTINPDMTDTAFFDTLHFKTHNDPDKHLLAEDIADTIEQLLSLRHGVAVTEITIRSQRFGILKK